MNPENVILHVKKDCILEGAPQTLVKVIENKLTVENPKYRDALKYGRWIGKKIKPLLYFYHQDSRGGLSFPRGFARKAIELANSFLGPGLLQILDERSSKPEIDLSFHGSLRDYQTQALEAILKRDFGVIESGTGSGKTVIALAAIAARRQPTLILVHTKELLYQWIERIETFLQIEAGQVGDGSFKIQPVTVAIVNSARKRATELADSFGQICVDECHRVPAALFTDVVTAFDCRYMLGLSATAFRRDGLTELIHFYLGERVWRASTIELEKSGAVLKPEFIQRQTEFNYVYRGNYQALMKALTKSAKRNMQIATDILTEAEQAEGTILVVSDRVDHCHSLADLLAEQNGDMNLQIAVLTGKTPAEERNSIVESLQKGEINVLFSTIQLIGEGFDCPGLRSLFLTTPIKFTGRLKQVVGRILRPSKGKKPRVYDYLDKSSLLRKSALSRKKYFMEDEIL